MTRAIFDYFVGKLGVENAPWIRKDTKSRQYKHAARFYHKYGKWTLLISYFPFIGKYFPFVAGVMGEKLSVVPSQPEMKTIV